MQVTAKFPGGIFVRFLALLRGRLEQALPAGSLPAEGQELAMFLAVNHAVNEPSPVASADHGTAAPPGSVGADGRLRDSTLVRGAVAAGATGPPAAVPMPTMRRCCPDG